MMNIPDPVWKLNPDLVADESYHIVYDDYDDTDEPGERYEPYEPFAVYDPD